MNEKEQPESSELKKRILARQKVQAEMDELRAQMRDLRKKRENGQVVDQDLEACMGYLKVLKKELESIKEGTHQTFLTAKKHISPKFNYGSKKEKLLQTIRDFAKEIRHLEKQLSGGGFETAQREELNSILRETKSKHQEALLELKALEEYNHTRFLEHKAREENIQKGNEEDSLKTDQPPVAEDLPTIKPLPNENSSEFNPPPMI